MAFPLMLNRFHIVFHITITEYVNNLSHFPSLPVYAVNSLDFDTCTLTGSEDRLKKINWLYNALQSSSKRQDPFETSEGH